MVLENSSLKGIFGQNMSYPPKWSLTDDSRFLQAAVLKGQHVLRQRDDGVNDGTRKRNAEHALLQEFMRSLTEPLKKN